MMTEMWTHKQTVRQGVAVLLSFCLGYFLGCQAAPISWFGLCRCGYFRMLWLPSCVLRGGDLTRGSAGSWGSFPKEIPPVPQITHWRWISSVVDTVTEIPCRKRGGPWEGLARRGSSRAWGWGWWADGSCMAPPCKAMTCTTAPGDCAVLTCPFLFHPLGISPH